MGVYFNYWFAPDFAPIFAPILHNSFFIIFLFLFDLFDRTPIATQKVWTRCAS